MTTPLNVCHIPLHVHLKNKLGPNLKNHAFISHKQSTAADMAGLIAEKLERRGLEVWFDMNTVGNLAQAEMKSGIAESKCYILLLTRDVFKSASVCMEFATAKKMKKPILFIHETQTNLPGFAPFEEYLESIPNFGKTDLKKTESLPFQRRKFLADPFLEELIERIDKN